MIIFFILGLILGGVAVMFALQNSEVIAITFFQWQLEGSLSVILALSILAGILIALFLTIPELINNYIHFRSLKKKNAVLEEELRKQRELAVFAKKEVPVQETTLSN